MNPLRTAAGLFPGNIFTLLPAAIAVLFVLTNALYVRGQQNANAKAEPTPEPAGGGAE
jgi:hypothetical protein